MSGPQKLILVVEDDPSTSKVLRTRLESEGFLVGIEGYGTTALRYAAEHQPDLVILDLRLPDMHGYEVARQLRQLFHPWALPILMLTAMDQPLAQIRGFAYGADAYLTKPYDATELLKTVALLLGNASGA